MLNPVPLPLLLIHISPYECIYAKHALNALFKREPVRIAQWYFIIHIFNSIRR